MARMTSLAAGACIGVAIALGAALPLEAQTQTDPLPGSKEASATSTPQPPTEPPASQPAPAAAEPAAPPLDPIVAQVRQQAGVAMRGVAAADRDAIKAFYEARTSLVWVTPNGLAPRARHAMAEIAQADDWGLQATAFDLPPSQLTDTSPAALADAEIKLALAVLKYARFARGGRLEPLQVSRNFDQKPSLREPKEVLDAVAATETPGDYLRDLHPRHQQFHLLRQALIKARSATGAAPQEEKVSAVARLPDGPLLKPGMEHPQIALLRKRLKVPTSGGSENLYDRDLQDAVTTFQRKNGQQPDGIVGARTRAALNGDEAPKATFGSDEQRIIVNMERWRWVPEHMGEFHVWDNIPEFQMRVVKRGQIVHQAKIIVGRPETQSALFSANMRYVIFGPDWGVPDSIKIKELLPYLRPSYEPSFFGFGGTTTDTRILEKHNLRVSYNGQQVDASRIDWSSVDIRKFNFIQPPGPTNVLGAVKFRFPNKHDIYMHDTPQRELFSKSVRTFSHGCIRVQEPGRLAEILLEEDKGWSAARVQRMMAAGGNENVTLAKEIPVHITYFTAIVEGDGQLRSYGDIYGHDHRVALAVAGRPLALEPSSVASESPRPERKDPRRSKYYTPPPSSDFFSGLFGN